MKEIPLIFGRKLTVEEAELQHPGIDDERVKRSPEAAKPFGFQSAKWEELRAMMKPNDELWTFRSPDEYWRKRAGREGIALVRRGEVIVQIVTRMS